NGSSDAPASQPSGTREQDKVFTGTASKALGDINIDVPFVVVSPFTITAKNVSGFFVKAGDTAPQPSSLLHHAGHYTDLTITAPEGASWTVLIRPLGPNLHHQTGRGDTKVGALSSLPDQVVVEFRGSGTAGNF